MENRKRYILFAIVCALVLLATLFMPLPGTHAQSTATITTDRTLYSVGTIMTIKGAGFTPGAYIYISVERPDHVIDTVTPNPLSDANGAFTATYTPPLIPGRYKISATDGTSTTATAVTQADAIAYNKNGYVKASVVPEDTTGNWSTGNQGQFYTENQWTFDQYEITGVGSSTTVPSFDVFFNHYESSSGAVFIDALANFRACVDCTSTDGAVNSGPSAGMLNDTHPLPPPNDTTGWTILTVGGTGSGAAILHPNRPLNTAANGSGTVVTSGQVGFCSSDNTEPANTPAQFHCFHVDGAALGALLASKLSGGGSHTISISFNGHLAASFVWGNGTAGVGGHEGSLGDCNSIYFPKPYTSNSATENSSFEPQTANSCSSTTSPIPVYGTDDYAGWTTAFKGVGFANGSSRHWSIANQTSGPSGAIEIPIPTVQAPSNTIVIVKQTVPSNATATFNFTGSLGSFSLSNPFPSQHSFSGVAAGVEYDVTESALAGWTLTSLSCAVTSGKDDGTGTWPTSGTGPTAAITLGPTDSGVTLTCTYTNSGTGHIIVRKHTTPAGAFSASFPFTTSGSGYTNFNLVDGGSNTDGGTPPAGGLAAGTYTVSEGAPIASQGGSFWVLSNVSCAITTTGSGTSTFTTSTTQPTSITLGSGDTVTCDYYNDWPDGNITITPPNPVNEIGHAETFTVTVNQVTDGATAATSANISTTVTPAPASSSTTCGTSVPFSGNTATCTVTINNPTVGKFTVHAVGTFTIGTSTLTRATGATTGTSAAGPAAPGPNSPDAVKTYVDARIGLTPATATNAIGQPHTITATVSQNLGDGNGFVAAPNGTLVTFSLLNNTAGATFVSGNTCTTTSGTCSIQINSTSAGGVDIHATTTFNVTVGGVSASLTRASGDGLSGDSVDAHKNYVGGTITIRKVTLPAGGTGFGYTTTGGLSPATFSLNDGGSQVYSGLGVGTFTVTENDPTPGYDLTNLACTTVSGTGTSATPTLGTRSLSITLGIGGNVDCTYTNTKRAHLVVVKHTNPAGAFSASFPFATTGTGYNSFNLVDGQSNTDGGANGLAPGTYTVNEGAPIASQGGSFWVLASRTCSLTTTGSGTSTFPASGVTQPASVTLGAGDTVTCVYTNDWPDGNITITPPNPVNEVGSPETFTIAVNQVTDGATAATSANITYSFPGSTPATVGPSTCGASVPFVGNTASCTVTINNPTPGTFAVHAVGVFTIGTATLTRATGATTGSTAAGPAAPGPNSPDAVKNYVDANITIGPATAKNEVGQQHTFNIVVTALPGGTGTPTFGTVTTSVAPTPSTLGTVACGAPVGNVESCTLTINSTTAGTFTANACTTVTMGGLPVAVCTNDAHAGDVGPAVKTYINPGTTLSLTTPPAAKVHTGDTVTLQVTETNTGGDPLTNVTVTGGGACLGHISPTTPISLAAGASQLYTCTFTAVDGANAWSATGNGTDSLNNAVPTTNEIQSGSVTGISPATTLTLTTPPPASVEAGPVTLVVTETNTGDDTLSNVTVTGGGACAGHISPTTPISLAAGASQAYTCTFTAVAGPNAWSASGNGTDSLGRAVPTGNGTPEYQAGSVNGVSATTLLTFVSQVPSLNQAGTVEAGTSVTITVNEANTGNSALSAVSVTGSPCATWSGPTSLAVGANANFTCTFTAAPGANAWSATGHGTDSLGNPESPNNEQQSGSFNGVLSTLIVVKKTVGGNGTFNFAGSGVGVPSTFPITTSGLTGSATFAGILSGPKSVAETVPAGWLGNTTNVSCAETAPGITPSSIGTLTSGTVAANGTISANVSLGIGATVTCTFTNALLPTLNIIKNATALGGPFNFIVTGPSAENPSLSVTSGNSAQEGVHSINTGAYTFAEDQATMPPGWTMTDLSCSTGTGSQLNNNGIPTLWSFTANYGDAIVCEATNSNILTTRTQGFWATHTALANNVWNGVAGLPNETPLGADAFLCTANPITAVGTYPPNPYANELMGGFWSNISQLSGKGGKRSPLDQARMQMLQQYLAAVLNVHAFGSGSEAMLSTARAAYCGTNVNAIKAQVGILGTFNQSGDNSAFTPGASATAPLSKNEANIPFWDVTFE